MARVGMYSFTPLATPYKRGLWSREWWSELLTVRGNSQPGNWVPVAQLSSRSQTTGYCLLLKPVDISRYLKSAFMSGLAMHIPTLKWYNTVRHQGRLLYFQAMVNLYHKSILKRLLHSRLILQNAGTYPLGMQIVSSGLNLNIPMW